MKQQKEQAEGVCQKQILTVLAERLPGWYETHKRTLPWRGTGNPYDVWLSEIMLQQTRVEAVKGYFLRFREALPDIPSLASCPEDQLLKLWEGLGYYSRVRNLQKCAKELMAEYGGKLPCEREELLRLPGIGSYTAGAIASIAYGRPVPAVDGNVLRVYARVTGDHGDIADLKTKKKVEDLFFEVIQEAFEASQSVHGTEQKAEGLASAMKAGSSPQSLHSQSAEAMASPFAPGIFNQSLMELGATVCLPNGAPLCEACPVQDICRARLQGEIDVLPVKTGKKPRRVEEWTVVILQDGDRFLIQKRAKTGLLAGLYEFPSLPGFCTEEAVLHAVQALSLDAVQIRRLPDAKHIFTHVEWRMRGYLVKLAAESRIRDAGYGMEHEMPQAGQTGSKGMKKKSGLPDTVLSASSGTSVGSGWIHPEHYFVTKEETEKAYALPSAFSAFARYLQIERVGDRKTEE